ncbi:MAG TPA: hypothetical protein VFQ67_10945 [Allosphingosinicella sp.]|jgi:hypothetical protein|nr:hypothetical protein [Allosphingosinicella sp.]
MSALLALFLAAAPAAETPRAFVERLYAGYRDPDYSPLARPERVFAAPLVAAIREDQRLSKDEVGYMDADPLCQCQDPTGLKPRIGEVRSSGRAAASVKVGLDFGSDRRELRLALVRTARGWRVADVATVDEPSLLQSIRRFNRRRSR